MMIVSSRHLKIATYGRGCDHNLVKKGKTVDEKPT